MRKKQLRAETQTTELTETRSQRRIARDECSDNKTRQRLNERHSGAEKDKDRKRRKKTAAVK